MPSHVRTPLSASQWVAATAAIGVTLLRYGYLLPVNLFRFSAWPLKRTLLVTLLQAGRDLAPFLKQAFEPTTGEAVGLFCGRTKRASRPHRIDCGSQAAAAYLHQVQVDVPRRPVPQKRVLVYMHGGAYLSALKGVGHPFVALDLAAAAGCESIYFLEYTLAPGLKYPGQLVQAAHAIRYVVETQGVSASQIYLAGDSAGAHLILSLLAHCVQPHAAAPDLTDVVNARSKFAAAVLISPCVSFDNNYPSNDLYKSRDVIPDNTLERMIDALEPNTLEVHAEPFLEESSDFWTERVPVEAVCMTMGEWEVLRDQILRLAKMMGATESGRERRLVFGPREIHVNTGFDRAIGIGAVKGGSCEQSMRWLESLDE